MLSIKVIDQRKKAIRAYPFENSHLCTVSDDGHIRALAHNFCLTERDNIVSYWDFFDSSTIERLGLEEENLEMGNNEVMACSQFGEEDEDCSATAEVGK